MNFNEMTLEALEERKAAIGTECEAEGADTNALLEEVRSINAEIEARKAAEAEKAEIRKAVAEGTEKTTTIETISEETRKMENFEINSVEYRNAFLKNLQGKALDEVEQRAFAVSGSPVPTLVSDKFFEKMKKLAPMLNEITLFRVAGNLKFYSESVRDAADAHTENASITAGANDAMVAVTLGAFEFAKVISISKAAQAMSIDAFEGWLVDILSGDLARAIDNYILNDSTNGMTKTTFTTNTNQILNTAATYTYKNVIDLIALLPAAYDAEAKFLVNKKTLYGQIANITTSSGQPIFVESPETGLGRIMGYPVVVDDYVSTANNALYLGKWKDIVGNMSIEPTVEKNESSGFRYGSIDFRGFTAFDSKLAKTDAVVRLVSTTA